MGESVLSFIVNAAGYAWTLIPGALTWWLLDFPELCMSEARKKRYVAWTRENKPYVVVGVIVLGLFVSMFLAFDDERSKRILAEKRVAEISAERSRIATACDPVFEWVGMPEMVKTYPHFKGPALVKRGRVTPLSREPFFMTVEAHGVGLDAIHIVHQTAHKDPDPRMRQLRPSGIEARALNPFSIVDVVALVSPPHEVTFSEPDFYCVE